MVKGKITRMVPGRGFFFVDKDYICYVADINFEPKLWDEVEYEPSKNDRNQNKAINVRKLVSTKNIFDEYLEELQNGFFDIREKRKYIKKDFLIKYPIALAELFSSRREKELNKVAQVMKWFTYCRNAEGRYKLSKNFNEVQIALWRIRSFLNDAYGRKKISEEFKIFLEKNVELASQDVENYLNGFMLHFEAFIGFYRNKKGE